MPFIPVMAKLDFQPHYSSLQRHMILQKSLLYADYSQFNLYLNKNMNFFRKIVMTPNF